MQSEVTISQPSNLLPYTLSLLTKNHSYCPFECWLLSFPEIPSVEVSISCGFLSFKTHIRWEHSFMLGRVLNLSTTSRNISYAYKNNRVPCTPCCGHYFSFHPKYTRKTIWRVLFTFVLFNWTFHQSKRFYFVPTTDGPLFHSQKTISTLPIHVLSIILFRVY